MFEFLFKYPLSVYRKGEFLFASGLPLWLLPIAIIAAAAGIRWYMQRGDIRLPQRKQWILWGFQVAMAALALLMVWQPGLAVRSLKSEQNVVSILVDLSRSMALGEGEQSRLQQAVAALDDGVIEGLRERFSVRFYGFSGDVSRLESLEALPDPGNATHIGDAVAGIMRESAAAPLGAVIVVSDGSDNSGRFSREMMSEIRASRVPVHTIGVGRTSIPGDIELSNVDVAARSLPKSRVTARATIQHAGEGGETRLTVRDGTTILASKDITLRRGENVQAEWVDFPAGDPGIRDLRFSLDPLPEEEIVGNNYLRRVMDVPRGRKKILYLEGEPRWEYKFIRRATLKDASVQLVSLLRTSTNKYYRQGVDSPEELEDGFPATAEELFAYDGLIIGSFEAAFFTPDQQRMIRDFVGKRGGTLLMLGGRTGLADGGWGASQVAETLPTDLVVGASNTFVREKAKVSLTVQGRESLITRLAGEGADNSKLWNELPELADYQTLGELKPAAVTLLNVTAAGREAPLLVRQNYGRGKTMILATGGTWRWKMSLPHEDERHHTFWRQMLRAISADSPGTVTISSDRSLYADDPAMKLRAEVRTKEFEPANNAIVTASLTADDGSMTTVEMHPSTEEEGIYLADVTATKTGAYRIEAQAFLGDDSLGAAALHVRREDGVAEDFRPVQNRELLTRLAEQTGGQYWELDELSGLPEQVRFSDAGITAREILDLWDMPILFLLLLGLKAGEWMTRRQWGLI